MLIKRNPALRPCACGKKNQHSLREAGQCDWQKRTPAERAKEEAKRDRS